MLAFVLATALWLYVNSHSAPELSFAVPSPVPISPLHVPQGLTVRNTLPTVHVEVRQSVPGLPPSASQFVASVDLYRLGRGTHHHVRVELTAPTSVSIVTWKPHYVTVVLDKLVTKRVPVEIHVLSALPYGYALKRGTLYSRPSHITVAGSKTYVDQVATAAVFVPLQSVRSSINLSSVPTLENTQGQALPNGQVGVSPQRVRVHGTVQQLASYKTLSILPQVKGEPAPGFGVTSIQAQPPGLTAYGSPKALSGLQFVKTSKIDVSGLKQGSKEFRVHLALPHGVYTPSGTVTIRVVIGEVTGEASIAVAVLPKHLGPGLTISSVQPGSVLVTLSGPSPQLNSPNLRVRARLNVSGDGPGSYDLAPIVKQPGALTIRSIEPRSVRVVIKRSHR